MDHSKVKIWEDACETIGRENNVKIMKLAWLSKLNPDKLYGSLVVYLSSQKEAEGLLNRQVMDFGSEAGFTKVYECRQYLTRCQKCLQYGHVKARCTSDVRCTYCAALRHKEPSCTATEASCAVCQESHKVSDPGCPTYCQKLRELYPLKWAETFKSYKLI